MRWALLAVLASGVLYGIHRLAIWAEGRGWIYYQKASGTLGNAALEAQSLVEPSKRYLLEEQTRKPEDSEDSGDPPTMDPEENIHHRAQA